MTRVSRKEPEFLQFVECFSTGKMDEGIEDMIKHHTFSVSYPYPGGGLLSQGGLPYPSKEELEQAGWMQMIKRGYPKESAGSHESGRRGLDTAMGEGGPYYYEMHCNWTGPLYRSCSRQILRGMAEIVFRS